MISGGVGITPLMSILRYLTDRVWSRPIYLVNALRTSSDLIYEAELRHLAEQFTNVKMLHFYSQAPSNLPDQSKSDRWQEQTGYISAQELDAFVPNIAKLPVLFMRPGCDYACCASIACHAWRF
ncbi:MAG: hypothetical protein ACK5YR_05830 [Pirellula sp.]